LSNFQRLIIESTMSFPGVFLGRSFRCSILTLVATLILAFCEKTNASGASNFNTNVNLNRFEVYDLPAIQWACEPYLDANSINERNGNTPVLDAMKEETRKLCTTLRGGNISIEETCDNHVEKEKRDKETNVNESHIPCHGGTTTGQARSMNEQIESAAEDTNYVPSAAPTSSTTDSTNDYTFSIFQEGDGHETDPDGIPLRYMKMQNNRRDLAKAALEKTVQWRKENDIDTILARPHPKYDVSKAVFPHYFCGRDDTQHVILVQRPGLMNVKLAHKNDLTGEDLLLHYIYVMEYLWRIIDPEPDATMTSIIDLTDMNISILRKREQLRIGSLFLSTMDAHFPQRSYKTYLINAPKWFGALYKLASPLLRESTKEKIRILSKGKEQDEILGQLLQDCPIPEGEKRENVPPGIMEEEMRNFCLARLKDAGVSMQPVEGV